MANVFDYIKWRGDLTFEQSPLNEIDALIFCEISYIFFSNIFVNENDEKLNVSSGYMHSYTTSSIDK